MKASRKIIAAAALVILLGCASNTVHKLIAPLPAGIDVNNLTDCIVPADFSADDFHWMGGNLGMTVFNRDLYDAVDVSQMQEGDTLLYQSSPVVIQSIKRTDNGIDINGGLEQGGQWLAGNGGGTYVARQWDDHAVYSSLGKTEMALASGFVIIDCGLNPSDPVDTIRTPKLYIESLQGFRREFNHLNTTVTIEDGMITEINRHWIP